jgi:beta-1,4-mannosyl-glycoprotein beta-1,4-N-acetylglucosaminyltransferase
MIYDCFPFNNELDLLDIRLHVLDDYVDRFVLCESPWTQAGRPKSLHFNQNKSKFAEFLPKITHLVVDQLIGGTNHWLRENYQRNFLINGLQDAKSDDLIFISDLDEIWDPKKLGQIQDKGITIFMQNYYRYYLNLRSPDRPYWLIGTRVVRRRELSTPQEIRNWGGRFKPVIEKPVIFDGGWHFSDLGGPEVVREKLVNSADQQLDPAGWGKPIPPGLSAHFAKDFSNLERVRDRIAAGQDVKGVQPFIWRPVPIDETFPAYIRENKEKFAHLIYKEPIC